MFVEAYNRYEEFKSISVISHKYRKLFNVHSPTAVFFFQFDSPLLVAPSLVFSERLIALTFVPLLCFFSFVWSSFLFSLIIHLLSSPFRLSSPSHPSPYLRPALFEYFLLFFTSLLPPSLLYSTTPPLRI